MIMNIDSQYMMISLIFSSLNIFKIIRNCFKLFFYVYSHKLPQISWQNKYSFLFVHVCVCGHGGQMLRIGRLGPSQAVALRCALPVGFGLQPCHPSFLFLLKLTLLNLWPQTCNASFGLDTAFFSYSMSNHCLLQSSVHGAAWTL